MHLKVVPASRWWVKLYTWQSWLPLAVTSCSAVSKFILQAGPTGPGAGVCGFIVFGSWGGKVVGSWSPVQVLQSAASLFLFTSYVTRSWLLRRSWRWRSPAARGRVQQTDGTCFRSHSEISWLQIQRSWKKRDRQEYLHKSRKTSELNYILQIISSDNSEQVEVQCFTLSIKQWLVGLTYRCKRFVASFLTGFVAEHSCSQLHVSIVFPYSQYVANTYFSWGAAKCSIPLLEMLFLIVV